MNAEAKAFQVFVRDYPQGFDPTTLHAPADQRQFLRNRLELAFFAGVKEGEHIARDRLVGRIEAIMEDVD